MKVSNVVNAINSQKAFTLAEILVVIAVIGLLSSIIFAITSGTREQGRIAKGLYFSQHLHNSLGSYAAGIWNFDDGSGTTANDTSGWENNGTLVNTPVWRCASTDTNYTPSGQGCSLEFNGSNQYIDIGDEISLKSMGSAVTVEAWAKYNAYGGGGQSYSVIAVKGSPWTFLLENPSQRIRFRVTAGGVDANAQDSATHELNRWYHFVGTYDGTNIKIYKDGVQVGITPRTGALAINDITAKIGTYQGTNYNFNGLIDEVRIYATSLTSAQIQSRYYAGLEKLLAGSQISQAEYQNRLATNK
jgi:prepilin-type N-terminal cleavage/methylation domain-containing protein